VETSILTSPRNVDPDLAREVATAFLAAPSLQRDDLISTAYGQLESQSNEIFDRFTRDGSPHNTIEVRFTRCGTPYDSDEEMVGAVRSEWVLEVSSAANERDRRHPLMDCRFGGAYDRFRAVHDIVGHVIPRLGFDRDGEFAAWLIQENLYRGIARWALATELHAEHSVRWTTGVLSEHKAVLLDRDLLARSRRSH
jgi:hypothetical protein